MPTLLACGLSAGSGRGCDVRFSILYSSAEFALSAPATGTSLVLGKLLPGLSWPGTLGWAREGSHSGLSGTGGFGRCSPFLPPCMLHCCASSTSTVSQLACVLGASP